MTEIYDAEAVIYRLEEAGRTLLSLPATGMSQGMRNFWPTIVRAGVEAYGYTPEQGALGSDEREWRPPVPSAAKIDRMDESFRWVAHIPRLRDKFGHESVHGGAMLARIVWWRLLVSPRTERNLYSYTRIGQMIGVHKSCVQLWHGQGINAIVSGLNGKTQKSVASAGSRSRPNMRVIMEV